MEGQMNGGEDGKSDGVDWTRDRGRGSIDDRGSIIDL